MLKKSLLFFCLCLLFSVSSQEKVDISKSQWRLWLDTETHWEQDELNVHSPAVKQLDIMPLKVNIPSCGWEDFSKKGLPVHLPATVEEHFWDKSTNSYGVCGDYTGVSWFTTQLNIPTEKSNKRIFLEFESVRLRAEVFVNRQLVGVDIVFGTSFKFDITDYVKHGVNNEIAVRITDPDGNFTWTDFNFHKWGNYKITPSHGFGGITGRVFVTYTEKVYFDDIYIKNKPKTNSVTAELTLKNTTKKPIGGVISYQIYEDKDLKKLCYSKSKSLQLSNTETVIAENIELSGAKLWSPETPNLYYLKTTWKGNDGTIETSVKRFGFRWFEVKNEQGERYFALNGKRIVLRTAISWGYWPVNGIYPTPELAEKQIKLAKSMGLNMLNFHRGIGQTLLLDLADELGLLYYEEPGGYKSGGNSNDDFLKELNRTRLFRMIKRDRSHPSLIIYNMINEISNRQPMPHEIQDLRDASKIDNTRIITFTSTNFFKPLHGGTNPTTPVPVKSHILPYDTTVHIYGWWDQHFPDGPGVYCDRFYQGKDKIFRNSTNKAEIVMWGEEGAIGTPPRVELIKNEIEKTGKIGWDGDAYLNMFKAYNQFLNDNKPFKKAFPTVDDFTYSFGNVAMYYQGRIIENTRIGNVVDCYVVNGWESEKIENHSGVVDIYRNPKGDPEILKYYNQPLYISVKIRNKVVEAGQKALVDFYIVNEKNIKGNCRLLVEVTDKNGICQSKSFTVKASGGITYGELLTENFEINTNIEGYYTVKATLLQQNKKVATGEDKLYAVNLKHKLNLSSVALYDDSLGTIAHCLKTSDIQFSTLKSKNFVPETEKILFIGAFNKQMGAPDIEQRTELFEWVKRGNTIVVLKDADLFAAFLSEKEILDYRGKVQMRNVWWGGNYAVAENPYFDGLPQNCVFNWEYQALAQYHKNRWALRLGSGECLVAAIADHKAEVYSALQSIKLGHGQIILSTLDIPLALHRKDEQANVVAAKILRNIVYQHK